MATATDAFGYTAADVAQALQRLSQVTAASQLVVLEGASLAPEDLQQRWQYIAQLAVSGSEMDGLTIDHLKVIYNYIEAVIVSCGTPDSFDVYEVCFETLTKIGFCIRSPAAKEPLMRVLEDVHEVYDVLLSCVETYEWVQPGATGSLRLWMLQVVFGCFGFDTITGRHLMELTDNDVSGAVSLVSFVLRCGEAPFEMQMTAGRCLVELTTADSVFLQGAETGEDTQSQQISKLTGMLNRHVNGLIKGIIQFDIVEAFGRCICQHQMSHARTDVIVKYFLTTIHNCLLYCSENQKKLRQHLATQSTVVQDIMIPYVHNILPALYDNPVAGPACIEWQNLKATLQTFVVVTFNINVFRPQLRDVDLVPKVLEVPNITSHISMLELLIKICINVDFTKGPYSDMITSILQGAFSRLPEESQKRLQRRLTSEQGMRLPYSKSSPKAIEALSFAIQAPPGEEPAAVAADVQNRRRRKQWKSGKGWRSKARKRGRFFGIQKSSKEDDDEEGEPTTAPGEECEDDSDDDDMPPLIPADGWESHLGRTDEVAGIPSRALCELTGAMMCNPLMTPDGHLFERAALEDWFSLSATNPSTGAPLSLDQCAEANDIQSYIQGYQMQMLSVGQIAPEAFAEPPPAEAAAPAPAPAAAALPASSLLGELPTLGKPDSPKNKKVKGKIKISSRSVVDCPEDMRCAIDGKVCTNPVRSPYGHLFEKKTVERWMQNCGSVCPVTSQPLRLEDLQPDGEMKKRIVQFLRSQGE